MALSSNNAPVVGSRMRGEHRRCASESQQSYCGNTSKGCTQRTTMCVFRVHDNLSHFAYTAYH